MQSVDGRIELCKTHIKTYIDFKFFIQMLLLYRQLFIYLLFVSKRRQKKKKKIETGSSVFKAQEKYLSLMGRSDMYWNISVDQGG